MDQSLRKEERTEIEREKITIGYYPLRGKAQVPRLIC